MSKLLSTSTLTSTSTSMSTSRNDIKLHILNILGDKWEYYYDTDYLPYRVINQDDCTNITFMKKQNVKSVSKIERT